MLHSAVLRKKKNKKKAKQIDFFPAQKKKSVKSMFIHTERRKGLCLLLFIDISIKRPEWWL